MKNELLANHAIEAREVRVIGSDGEQLGILPLAAAVAKAQAEGLDLMLMSPNAKPPVCKIMDYGKYKYEQSKKAHEAKKKQHVIQIKEVKLRPTTDQHDLEIKLKNIRKFLGAGNKVKVTIRFRGREMAYADRGAGQLKFIVAQVEDMGKAEKMPALEGRQMMVVIAPLKK